MGDFTTSIFEKLKEIVLNLCSSRRNSGENEKFCDRCSGVRNTGTCAGKENGSCCCNPDGLPSPLCVYYSPRIMYLLNGEKTEFDTAREHWTVLDPQSVREAEMIADENRKYFDEVLAKHPEWGAFFTRYQHLEVGEKLGEGAQAEIFAASFPRMGNTRMKGKPNLVAKVWKEGVSLKHLERQWPREVMSKLSQGSKQWPFKNISGGVYIREGGFKNRFAFVMRRFTCDLRAYIDRQMLELFEKKSHGPPFKDIQNVYSVLYSAATDLEELHQAGVVHRDIKASNILTRAGVGGESFLIDYECSVGVIGTGFWRAPEILEQVQKRVPSSELVFTKKADIYSFGMMCYEMVTGCIPFEGHPQNDYSIVLRGERPHLPEDLNSDLKNIIEQCWDQDPLSRPSASELVRKFDFSELI
ncbi:hypothetical protein KC19_9G043400 [Ceratodon purpureus]|uniref:Protein kinase domain-containing protein n=1 Tax=Ceratodon purpureus TaxID=3225 RepID=A0A8T0GNN4_CERPU|nr:hypothetical protein KC19_9G043400 [Ceratodon purpureus]